MEIMKLDDRFSTAGQLRPEQVQALAAEGYTLIVRNRPTARKPDSLHLTRSRTLPARRTFRPSIYR